MSFPEITGNTMISNSINIPSAIAITDTLQTCNFANNFTGAQAVFNCTRDSKILGTTQYYTQYPGPNNVVTQVPSSFDTGKNIITGSQKNASNAKSNAGFNRSMPRKKDFVNRKVNGALVYKKTDPSTGLPFIPEIDNGDTVYQETVNRLLNVRVQGPPTTNTGPARFVSSLMDNATNPSVIDVDPVTGLKHLTQTRIVVASQEAGTDILVQPNSTSTRIPPATTDYVRRLGSDRLKCPTVNGVYDDAPTAACSQTFITPVFAGNSVMTNLARPMVANDRMNVTNFVTANIASSIILPHP